MMTMDIRNNRLYSRYAVEYAAEHAYSKFKHFVGCFGSEQEAASCDVRNRVVDRQNEIDGTELPYFDEMGQKKTELRFEFIHDEAMKSFPVFHERQWFLDEVVRIQDELDE